MAIKRVESPQAYAPVVVRPLRRDDLPSCHRIDRVACPGTNWDEAKWHDTFPVYPALVAVQSGIGITFPAVAGFVVYSVRSTHVRIEKLAVHPRCWRTGVGTILVGAIVDIVRTNGRNFAGITVPLDLQHVAALSFFKYLGWIGYLTDAGDAVSLVRENRRVSS